MNEQQTGFLVVGVGNDSFDSHGSRWQQQQQQQVTQQLIHTYIHIYIHPSHVASIHISLQCPKEKVLTPRRQRRR